MKRKLDEKSNVTNQKPKRQKFEIIPSDKALYIKNRLTSTYNIDEKDVQILGLGDCVFVKDVFKDKKMTKNFMDGIQKECKWIDPSDPRAPRNRAKKPLGRMKSCLRKYQIDDKGRIVKPFYGGYVGSSFLHSLVSSEMTKEKTPFAYTLCDFSNDICGQDNNHGIFTCYRNENDSISGHQDKIKNLEKDSLIISWSFGETRELYFEPIDPDGSYHPFSVTLQDGSFFVMGPKTNKYYKHSVPKQKKKCKLRMSAIFRSSCKFVTK